jgi:hypothetical protein
LGHFQFGGDLFCRESIGCTSETIWRYQKRETYVLPPVCELLQT